MTNSPPPEDADKKADRLARARAFLAAGRREVDVGPDTGIRGLRATAEATRDVVDETPGDASDRPDPTRYGDWEKNGRCFDF